MFGKKLVTEKKESTNLPIDPENALIIVPNNVEIATLCTNLTQTYEDLAKKEEIRKRKEQRVDKPMTFVRKEFLAQKKKVVKPAPLDRNKVMQECIKLERGCKALEKEIDDLQKGEQINDTQKEKEINEIQHLTDMIKKWKGAAQEGIIELHKKLSEQYPDMTLNKVVDLLKVDPH